MHKWLWGAAAVAAVIGYVDLQAPAGSRSAMEGALLWLVAVLLLAAGAAARGWATRRCSACDERVRRAAKRCPHCQADVT